MTKEDLATVTDVLFENCRFLRKAGQQEYAGKEDNPFGNFERLSPYLGISREHVLMVYFMKHIDGIMSYLNGHTSQREHVSGRIKDAIVYLTLLNGMITQNELEQNNKI